MTGWNNGRAFACRAGDRWFESRREHFAKKVDYFMIFAIYSRPGPGREGGNVTKEFKLVLESDHNHQTDMYLPMQYLVEKNQFSGPLIFEKLR